MKPLTQWGAVAVVGGILLLTTAAVVLLWWAGTAGLRGEELVTARLDALRTGLGVGIVGGGASALHLFWRRQRVAEIALVQVEAAQEHVKSDARERRIAELHAKAAEQLGSDKAPVRLAGFYALARLAQGNPDQRQTVVDVLCAYLRMPCVLPGEPPADDAPTEVVDRHHELVREREVRLTAQRVLGDNLGNGEDVGSTSWKGVDLDLTAATLIDFELSYASAAPRSASRTSAR